MVLREDTCKQFPVSSFSSRWHRSARKGPYALHPVSQLSPQGCPRNSASRPTWKSWRLLQWQVRGQDNVQVLKVHLHSGVAVVVGRGDGVYTPIDRPARHSAGASAGVLASVQWPHLHTLTGCWPTPQLREEGVSMCLSVSRSRLLSMYISVGLLLHDCIFESVSVLLCVYVSFCLPMLVYLLKPVSLSPYVCIPFRMCPYPCLSVAAYL